MYQREPGPGEVSGLGLDKGAQDLLGPWWWGLWGEGIKWDGLGGVCGWLTTREEGGGGGVKEVGLTSNRSYIHTRLKRRNAVTGWVSYVLP